MKERIRFGIVDLGAYGAGVYGVYAKPRGVTLGEWQVYTGLMFYPMVGWMRP